MSTTKVAAAPMKVAQISNPGADFQIVEREIPTPDARQVRIKVQACGVCHSDALTKDGSWPGIQYPRVPGHEVVGIIDELGVELTIAGDQSSIYDPLRQRLRAAGLIQASQFSWERTARETLAVYSEAVG